MPWYKYLYYFLLRDAIQFIINFILRFFDVKIRFDNLYLIIDVFTDEYEIKIEPSTDCDVYFKGSQINLIEYEARARLEKCIGFDINRVYYKIKYPKLLKCIFKIDIEYFLEDYKKYTHTHL